MKPRDALEFGFGLVLFFIVLWLLFAAEDQAGLLSNANGGWGR